MNPETVARLQEDDELAVCDAVSESLRSYCGACCVQLDWTSRQTEGLHTLDPKDFQADCR
jgi:hypothetical protein